MPYRMGSGNSALSFSRRDSAGMGAARTAVRLSPSFTGMSMRSDGMGPGFAPAPRRVGRSDSHARSGRRGISGSRWDAANQA